MNLHKIDFQVKQWFYSLKKEFFSGESDSFQVSTKKNERDLVTSVDKAVERFLRDKIMSCFSQIEIIGEEEVQADYKISGERVWTIDPIDGTANFVKQKEDFCILLAYFENNQPQLSYIYNVCKDEILYAIRGEGVFFNGQKLDKPDNISIKDALFSTDIRKIVNTELYDYLEKNCFDFRYIGCAGLEAVKVATGHFGAYMLPAPGGVWDYAPMLLLAEELDLHLSTWKGEPLSLDKSTGFIFCTPKIYEEVKEYLNYY